MNHTYRVVYNESTNTYVAVAEFEPSKGKSKSSKKAVAVAVALAAAQLVPLTAQAAVSIGSTSGTRIDSIAAATTTDRGVAVGAQANANYSAVAVGHGASATGTDVAVGPYATATGTDNIAIGNNSKASSTSELNYGIIAIGNQSKGSASETIAIGQWACATASQAVALGAKTQATGEQSVALGGNAISSGAAALAFGGDDLDKASSVGLSTDGKPNTTGSEINKGAVNTEFKRISGQDLVKKIDKETSTNNTAAQYMPTNAYGAASIAIGIQSRSGDLATAFGTQSFATGLASTALGVASNASGNGSIAIGPGTDAIGEQSIGMGANATSNNSHSIAIGTNATTSGSQSISIGYANNVSGNNSGAFGDLSKITGSGAYTVGNNNTMAANEAGAFGNNNDFNDSANYSRAVGNRNNVSGSNTMVLGNDVNATTNGSVVLGNSSSGSMSVVTCSSATVNGITYGNFTGNVTDAGKYVSVGANATDARKIVNVAAGNIASNSTEAINGSQLYMTQNVIGNLANSTAQALGPNSTVNTNGTISPNITVNGSTATYTTVQDAINNVSWNVTSGQTGTGEVEKTTEEQVKAGEKVKFIAGDNLKLTQNGQEFTYSLKKDVNLTTEGSLTVGSVSINKNGINAGNKPITNVSNGTNGTDAVNLSQLNATKTKVEGDKGITVTSTVSATDGTAYKVTADTITVTHTGGKVAMPTGNDGDKLLNVTEVAKAINNSGFNVIADRVDSGTNSGTAPVNKLINPGATVKFVAGSNMDIEQNGSTFTFRTNNQNVVENAQLPVVYTNENGDKLVKGQNGKFYKPADIVNATYDLATKEYTNAGTKIAPATTVIASMNNGENKTTAPTTLANVKGNLNATYNKGNLVEDQDHKLTDTPSAIYTNASTAPTPDVVKKIHNNAATVGDVLNAGWNLKGNGVEKDFVKPYDTVNFVNGAGTTATVTSDGNVSNVSYNVAVDNKTTQLISVDKKGNPLVQAADGKYYPADTKMDASGNPVDPTTPAVELAGTQVVAKTTELAPKIVDAAGKEVPVANTEVGADGKLYNKTDLDPVTKQPNAGAKELTTNSGAVATPVAPNSLVNASTVAKAINNSGFNVIADKVGTGTNSGKAPANKLINPGATVKFVAGDNMDIGQDGSEFTFRLAKDITVDSVTAGKTKLNTTGVTITGSAADPTKTVSLTNAGLNNGGNRITNVAAGVNDTDAVNVSQLKSQVAASKETVVSKNQTVRIKESTNATGGKEFDLSVNTGKSLTVSSSGVIDVKTDGTTIKKGTEGALEVVTTGLTPNTNGSINKPTNGSSLVNATTVADAINNSGWNLQANGDTASKVSPGNTVQFINGDNINITRDGNNITVATSKDINVKGDLTVAGNTTVKNFTVNPNSTVNMGGNKIINVAAGVNDTDAVNVSQLKSRVAASKEEVISNDKTVRINVSTNATTGANIYDVSVNTGKSLTVSSSGVIDVKTDGTTIKKGTEGALEVVTTGLTPNTNGSINKPTNGSSLVNATTVADAINNSGWNLQANGDTASKVSPGNTVQFLNGGNIDIKRDGNNITVATSKNINVAGDLTVAGNTTVKNFTVNPNSTVNMGGNKVQGVAAGVISANSTDAINGSQLYYTNQAIGANINNVANNLNARINDVADDADAGTASAMATAGVPQAYLPGKSMVAVGASTYRGKQGYAVGFSAISDSGNWIVKGTASGNSRGHFGATVGAGYQW
ncbi:YadA-like family protein [Kingella kingae]|uniref:YadA-like family protein n=2 Tax=Kingella kingae TaxID=504 RepID=UPI00254DE163|nr:YadA-like family protein [Kingella kingae]MDK4546753.1 YadA-like family protein [Kingella kingae]